MLPAKHLSSPLGRCSVNGRELAEGEEFYSALFEDGDSFRRVDFAPESWAGPPEGAFCYFRSHVPVRKRKKRMFVDDEALIAFFTRLAGETDPVRVEFRFVLALLLMRKRLLRYEGSRTQGETETWDMTLVRDGSSHRVTNPRLTDDRIAGVSTQLTAILHGDMAEWIDDIELDTPGDPSQERAPNA